MKWLRVLTTAPLLLAVGAWGAHYWSEVGWGSLTGGLVAAGGAALAWGSQPIYDAYGNPDETQAGAGIVIFGCYPAVMSTTIYVVGEKEDGRSSNGFTAWGLTTATAYVVPAVAFSAFRALALATTSGEADLTNIVPAVIVGASQPFAAAWVYNKIRKPPAPADSRARPEVRPFTATLPAGKGSVVPVYGLSLSF